ncbi:hypothetical protein [Paenibacillus terrigena]|uniref:hypothetical protein n=1 Tax=Paenibacillus terrigena TaxID=369333 RepID=UPI00035E7579
MEHIVRTIRLSKAFQGLEVVPNVNMNMKKDEIYDSASRDWDSGWIHGDSQN